MKRLFEIGFARRPRDEILFLEHTDKADHAAVLYVFARWASGQMLGIDRTSQKPNG